MTTADVTAIVPTFNRAHYLGECLQSLLDQTLPPRQVLVVDDGSTGDTAAVVAGFGIRVEYLRQDNAGKASALNAGMAQARGAAIWIFDDDDVAHPRALERLHAALSAHPDAGFAFGDYDNFSVNQDGERHYSRPARAAFDSDDLFCAILERCFIFQPALLVRRWCYDAVGAFDTSFVRAQDYEMLVRLTRLAPGIHVPEILFHQRQHQEARGTAHESISGSEVWERQQAYDARVLETAYRSSALADYLPRSARPSGDDPAATVRGLLRRGAVMARKRLWPQAVADFRQAAAVAGAHGIERLAADDAAVLGRIFDEHGYARADLGIANPLLALVRGMRSGGFRTRLLQALTWPVFRYALQSVRHGRLGEARRHAQLYAALGGVGGIGGHFARAFGKAAASPASRLRETFP